MSFNLIKTLDDLNYLNNELLSRPYIGVDTEFRRTNKDNMRLALLQVNDGEEIYLIDAVLISDPGDSCDFLFSDSVIKIFHSCKEDLEAIYSWTGNIMKNIFDTQLANAFLNGSYSIGYQDLVEQRLDVIIEKKETRSNWIRRPLTDSQLSYAASDVEFLIHLYETQKDELSKNSKLNWHDQDIERLLRFSPEKSFPFADLERTLSKAEESRILNQFNKVVEDISLREGINSTLLFSKKAQKDFLRLVLLKGLDSACQEITLWRSKLLREDLLNLLK